jgi:hypothetical protein
MAAYNLKEISWKELGEVFDAEAVPQPERLCAYVDGEDQIVVERDTFTVVLNRNIRKNIEIATAMGLFIANKYPNGNVLLVNTYAKRDLLQRSLVRSVFRSGVKLPLSYRKYFHETYICERDFDDTAPPPKFPPNLRILDCPASSLTFWRLEQALAEYPAETLIINSFEFANVTRELRMILAKGLIELREKSALSVLLFSHEMKADVAPYTPARGALGMISAYAGSVWRLMTPYEQKQWDYWVKCGRVNENKTCV